MKFSTTALVLATLAIESASAGTIRHAHKHLHEKKSAKQVEESKREAWNPPPGYDWHTDPGTVYNPNTQTAAPVVASTASVPSVASVPSATASASDTSGSGKSKTVSSSSGSSIMKDLSSFLTGSFLAEGAGKTIMGGANPTTKSASGNFVWISEDDVGDYTNTITNNAGSDAYLVVYEKSAALGQSQWVDQHPAAITVKLPQGKSVVLQFAAGASGAYFPIYSTTGASEFGLMQSTLGEFTIAGSDTTFDVSREWTMSGPGMTIDGGKSCISSTESNECAYVCSRFDYGDSCGTAGSYKLNKSSSSGCHVGQNSELDPTTNQMVQTDGGGCYVSSSIKTSLH